MDTLGGNFFLCLCNELFVLPNIALKWVKQPRSIMKTPYIPYYHPSMVWVYCYMADFESPNQKFPSCIHGRLKSFVHERRNLAQGEIQALIEKDERKFHGCTFLSCMGEAWFDIQVLEERCDVPEP